MTFWAGEISLAEAVLSANTEDLIAAVTARLEAECFESRVEFLRATEKARRKYAPYGWSKKPEDVKAERAAAKAADTDASDDQRLAAADVDIPKMGM